MNQQLQTSDSPLLSVRDIGLSYPLRDGFFKRKPFWALKNISFDLQPGDALGIIGGNGAGKSTLLRILAGVVCPDEGTVIDHTGSISLLGLNVGFVSNLTGRENAILGGLLLGKTRQEMTGLLDKIQELAELGDFFDQPIVTYSSGMRSRLGFAVAIQSEPDVLLVDEVTSVGDASFRQKSFKLMEEKLSDNKGLVFVSHHSRSVKQICNRVIWIDKGEISQQGDADEVIEAYEASMTR